MLPKNYLLLKRSKFLKLQLIFWQLLQNSEEHMTDLLIGFKRAPESFLKYKDRETISECESFVSAS